jgi:hypothetical protein
VGEDDGAVGDGDRCFGVKGGERHEEEGGEQGGDRFHRFFEKGGS